MKPATTTLFRWKRYARWKGTQFGLVGFDIKNKQSHLCSFKIFMAPLGPALTVFPAWQTTPRRVKLKVYLTEFDITCFEQCRSTKNSITKVRHLPQNTVSLTPSPYHHFLKLHQKSLKVKRKGISIAKDTPGRRKKWLRHTSMKRFQA